MVEYIAVTSAFFGFTLLGWPFLIELAAALQRYFASIYYVIQSPVL